MDIYIRKSKTSPIMGPVTKEKVVSLAHKGRLTSESLISTDKINWHHAADVDFLSSVFPEELSLSNENFQNASSQRRQTIDHDFGEDAATEAIELQKSPQNNTDIVSSEKKQWIYFLNNQQVGPVNYDLLLNLVTNKQLTEDCPCRDADTEKWVTVRDALGWPKKQAANGNGYPNSISYAYTVSGVDKFSFFSGLVTGIYFLVFLLTPFVWNDKKTIWAWDNFGDCITASVILIVSFISAPALIICAPLIKGLSRGVVWASISTVLLFLCFVNTFELNAYSFSALFAALVFLPAVLGTATARIMLNDNLPLRIFSCISGGLLAIASLIQIVVLLCQMSDVRKVLHVLEEADMSGYVIPVMILLFLGCVCLLASGILSIVSVQRHVHRYLTLSIRWLGLFGLSFCLSVAMIALTYAGAHINAASQLMFAALKFCTFVFCCSSIGVYGFCEIFMSTAKKN